MPEDDAESTIVPRAVVPIYLLVIGSLPVYYYRTNKNRIKPCTVGTRKAGYSSTPSLPSVEMKKEKRGVANTTAEPRVCAGAVVAGGGRIGGELH